jgi:alpha-beta hydrolase superfamily lysophospholipase
MISNILTLKKMLLNKKYCFRWYGRSIHVTHKGEWDFDISKKPIDKIRVHGATFAAIRTAQEDLMNKSSCIKCPVLLLCSNRSIKADNTWRDEYTEADLLLNVTTMRRAAATICQQVTIYEIENAQHDIFLSKVSVREKAFNLMFRWLRHLEDDWK